MIFNFSNQLKLLLSIIIHIFINVATGFHVQPLAYSMLTENSESVVDLTKSSEKRFYLQVSNELSPLFMYITPCGGAVHWQLFAIDMEMSMNDESAILTDYGNSLEQSEKFRLIAGEEDKKRMTFFAHRVPRKLLLVLRRSSTTKSSTSSRIFFTPSLFRLEQQYPPLPHDTRLATTLLESPRSTEISTQITWKVAPQVRSAEPGRYRICAIVSRQDPEFAGVCDHVAPGVETVKCVGQTNNSLIVDELRRDKIYYLSVFVRDQKTGSTSAYEVQTVQTSTRKVTRNVPRKSKKSAPRQMIDGILENVELEGRKGNFVNLRFPINTEGAVNNTQAAMLIVHACDGLIRINLFKNGKILKRSDAFSGFRRFVVTNIRSGNLKYQIVNDDEKPKSVRIWSSVDHSTSPYPNLPDDTSIKIVGRTCSSASIQWLRAHDSHVKYCVYRRRENSNFLEHLVSLADNLCEGGLSSSTLVGCYTHSSESSEDPQSLIETSVNELLPGSTYRLDLLATPLDQRTAQSLPYRTVWVRTNRFCEGAERF